MSIKHGYFGTPTYRSWIGCKERCYNSNERSYPHYGGRGIKVCDRWLNSFENFLEDMGERPNGTTLDRIDTNADYTPNNCKWSTHEEQQKTRRPVKVTEEIALAVKKFVDQGGTKVAATKEFGLSRTAIYAALKYVKEGRVMS